MFPVAGFVVLRRRIAGRPRDETAAIARWPFATPGEESEAVEKAWSERRRQSKDVLERSGATYSWDRVNEAARRDFVLEWERVR